MPRRRGGRRWEDGDRVSRAAMRHDLEEALLAKIERARMRLVRALADGQPGRIRAQLAKRVDELRAQLRRVEKLDT